MSNTSRDLAQLFFKQQAELGITEYYFLNKAAPAVTEPTIPDRVEENSVKPQPSIPVAVPAPKPSVSSYESKRAALIELYYEVKNCKGCALSQTRQTVVFGSGNVDAPLFIIGEAPGEEEDKQGKPFVGSAGDLLTRMLVAIDVNREKGVFITTMVKCKPPLNRDPNQSEVHACVPILERQITIIKPRAILVLGLIAAEGLMHLKEPLGKLRTQTHWYHDVPVVITYHPAALLRTESYKRPAWEDMKKIREILKEKGSV